MSKTCICCKNVETDNYFGVCKECEEKLKTVDNYFDVGRHLCEDVNINGFLTFCFTKEEIEDILYAELKSYPKEVQDSLVKEYYECNTSYFVKGVEKKCK